MQTQAYFKNIQQHILKELNKADISLQVAVAWLTDIIIFETLCTKAAEGVKVELLLVNDNINNEMASFNHGTLENHGGFVYFINPTEHGAIMHHKFCVIDNCTVITGSYNWSKKAQSNDENIIITWDACELGSQFQKEFRSIKERIFKEKFTIGSIDLPKIIKRLEVIKNFIILEERDEIITQVKKLKELPVTTQLVGIVAQLDKCKYNDAIDLIDCFIADNSQLVPFQDTEVFALQLEIQSLEVQLTALENEKIETEKLIQEFSVKHTQELGTLVLRLLKLRSQIAVTRAEKDEAANDERAYQESYNENKNKQIPTLSEEEKVNLKNIYRKASMLCHPDKFQNELEKQQQAEELFKQLAEAYCNNDVATVKQILTNLQNGILTTDATKQSNKKMVLRAQLAHIQQKIADLLKYLTNLKATDIYVTATENNNWETYFKDAKQQLQNEIETITKKIAMQK